MSPAPEIMTELPAKRYLRLMRNIRWTILSVYRRLNIIVLLSNIIAMVVLAAKDRLTTISPETSATAISLNLMVGVLMRQELVINMLFWLFGKCPVSLPLRLRRLAAKIYHLGGVHSGAGMAATIWHGLFNLSVIKASRNGELTKHKLSILSLTITLDVLLITIVVMAHPAIRVRFHNAFELVHRFAGWSTLALFWALFALLVNQRILDSPGHDHTIQKLVGASPVFWALIISTISVALPWVWLRKVDVHAEPLSDHAIRLHFTYTNLPLCAAPRLSDRPLLEWHAFAGIPQEDGQGFSVLVSKAGDWTSRLIRSPPSKIFVRGIPTIGVLHVAQIFQKVILVATGSGIGPVLSYLSKRDINCRILWSTPDPGATYSASVIRNVRDADPDAVIINTTVAGRPDLVRHTYQLYAATGAEAVFVISNPRVTRRLVYALESRGVPIFAPIFDS